MCWDYVVIIMRCVHVLRREASPQNPHYATTDRSVRILMTLSGFRGLSAHATRWDPLQGATRPCDPGLGPSVIYAEPRW